MSKATGKLLIAQSGGCTQVMNATLWGAVDEAHRHANIAAVIGAVNGIEGVLRADFVDLGRVQPSELRQIGRTPAAALGSCRRKLNDREADDAMRRLRDRGIRFFVYIGGNDSADTAHKVALAARRSGYDLRVMLAPKTIDNDLPVTDHSPGFGSAARFLATAVADVGMDTASMRSLEPVKIIEVKGRNAGWLAAASALAKRSDLDAPQLVWPPEVPFDEKKFLQLIQQWLKRIGFCVIVASETMRDRRGNPIGMKRRRLERDSFGHLRLVGAAEYLCDLVRDRLRVRARWEKPGSLQHMSSVHVSEVDRREARACGQWAVRFALRGFSDRMVVVRRIGKKPYRVSFGCTPLRIVANTERRLPAGFFDVRTMLPTDAFRRYAMPLVGPVLPEHARLPMNGE